MALSGSTYGGALLFSRFAYPPGSLGKTDQDFARDLVEDGSSFDAMKRLGVLARGFESALPYLELIAAASDSDDPLDPQVVEAYWIGSPLLDAVDTATIERYLDERAALVGLDDQPSRPAASPLLRPHHNFHVLAATPWAAPSLATQAPLEALDKCRVRWGRVLGIEGAVASVRSRPLVRTDGVLALGEARIEQARLRPIAESETPRVRRGDWCALHWDWVCDRISTRQLVQLRRYTRMQLDAINGLAE